MKRVRRIKSGRALRTWINEKGWTDTRAAAELGISRPTLYKYLSEGDVPRTVSLAAAALRSRDLWLEK